MDELFISAYELRIKLQNKVVFVPAIVATRLHGGFKSFDYVLKFWNWEIGKSLQFGISLIFWESK